MFFGVHHFWVCTICLFCYQHGIEKSCYLVLSMVLSVIFGIGFCNWFQFIVLPLYLLFTATAFSIFPIYRTRIRIRFRFVLFSKPLKSPPISALRKREGVTLSNDTLSNDTSSNDTLSNDPSSKIAFNQFVEIAITLPKTTLLKTKTHIQ